MCGSVVYVEQAPPCAAQLVPVIPVYIMVFRDLDSQTGMTLLSVILLQHVLYINSAFLS